MQGASMSFPLSEATRNGVTTVVARKRQNAIEVSTRDPTEYLISCPAQRGVFELKETTDSPRLASNLVRTRFAQTLKLSQCPASILVVFGQAIR